MKCLHCQTEIHAAFSRERLNNGRTVGEEYDAGTLWLVQMMECPACQKALVSITKNFPGTMIADESWQVYPRNGSRLPARPEVPPLLAEDFNEAGQVLELSPKASAALSRRCLQALLRDQGYMQKDLAPAIQAVLDARQLPSGLSHNLDAIRNIGNFAAHPMKDQQSGSIVAVEPHEAEWNLDVLEGLFDFYYVQPAKDATKIAALNAKLQAAGKPEIKAPTP
jgi:hypothetical protein